MTGSSGSVYFVDHLLNEPPIIEIGARIHSMDNVADELVELNHEGFLEADCHTRVKSKIGAIWMRVSDEYRSEALFCLFITFKNSLNFIEPLFVEKERSPLRVDLKLKMML